MRCSLSNHAYITRKQWTAKRSTQKALPLFLSKQKVTFPFHLPIVHPFQTTSSCRFQTTHARFMRECASSDAHAVMSHARFSMVNMHRCVALSKYSTASTHSRSIHHRIVFGTARSLSAAPLPSSRGVAQWCLSARSR